jgi:putative phosphoribosyl transferase
MRSSQLRQKDDVSQFWDRRHAGQVLAQALQKYAERQDLLVLGLARGGIPVAYEVAKALNAALDILVVRKLGVPWQEELAMGAIASGGFSVMDPQLISRLGISPRMVETVVQRESQELRRREETYRNHRLAVDAGGRTVILVDDGLATGSSMRAAIGAVRAKYPLTIVVAVPIGTPATCAEMRSVADDVVCARSPEDFRAVGRWYEDFEQTSDDEVRDLLERAAKEHTAEPTWS